MAASFFMTMVDVFGPESPLSGLTYLIRNIGGAANASFSLLIALPHLFGVLILLGAVARPRGLGVIRTGVRVHLILWFCANAVVVWPTDPDDTPMTVFSALSLGVVALGVPWLPGSRSRWTDSRFVRRGQQVGAVLCLLWFGQWAVTNDIYYGLPVAMLAAVAMLAGASSRAAA